MLRKLNKVGGRSGAEILVTLSVMRLDVLLCIGVLNSGQGIL